MSHKAWMILMFTMVGVLGMGGSIWTYRAQERSIRGNIKNDLESVADLKSEQISLWLRERQNDATMLSIQSAVREDLSKAMSRDPEAVKRLLVQFRLMRTLFGCDDFIVVNPAGHIRFSLSGNDSSLDEGSVNATRVAVRERKIMTGDLQVSARDPNPHFEIVVPFFNGEGSGAIPVGAIILSIRADRFLYPMIMKWPTQSRSAETLLVRKDGNSVLFLNELRHLKNTALRYRLPMSRTDVPAVMAVKGITGITEGSDYRNTRVFSAFRSIPDTNWFIVAKIDQDEVLAEWYFISLLIILMSGASILVLLLVLLTIWRRNEKIILSERQKADELVIEHERQYRFLFENMTNGFAHCRMIHENGIAKDFVYLTVNGAFGKLTGLKNVIGRTFSEVVPGAMESNPEILSTYARVSSGGPPVTFDSFSDSFGGWLSINVYSSRHGYFTAVFENISERKRLDEELKKTLGDLERSNKDFEQFAYVASHDMQEPLRTIASFLQLLEMKEGARFDTESREFIEFASKGAVRLHVLINDLLTYSQIQNRTVPVERVDLNAILKEVLDNLKKSIEESGGQVSVGDLSSITANKGQMIRLFQNLIGNALKFQNHDAPRVVVTAEQRAGEWVYSVKDNGIGIEPQYHEKVFQIFKRLNPQGKYAGTGIGLPICKRIVEQMGGRIWIETGIEKGTRVCFTLPQAAQTNKEPS